MDDEKVQRFIDRWVKGQRLLQRVLPTRVNPIPPKPPMVEPPAPKGTRVIECGPDGRKKKEYVVR